jgi:hypothetical protein
MENESRGSQTIQAVKIQSYSLNHPEFSTNSINSLLVTCKNHLFKLNSKTQKWAGYREIFGPSIIINRKTRTKAFAPCHKKLYLSGKSYRSGHYIIPNINLESHICKKWAHCSMIILCTNANTTRDSKIIIDNKVLELCFYFKLYISYKILRTIRAKDFEINIWINKVMKTNISEKQIKYFLENKGNMLAYIIDELSDLGLDLDIKFPQNRHRTDLISVNMKTISDFHEAEINPLFTELINLSCVGSLHMP